MQHDRKQRMPSKQQKDSVKDVPISSWYRASKRCVQLGARLQRHGLEAELAQLGRLGGQALRLVRLHNTAKVSHCKLLGIITCTRLPINQMWVMLVMHQQLLVALAGVASTPHEQHTSQ
jgi:hypothetical protein